MTTEHNLTQVEQLAQSELDALGEAESAKKSFYFTKKNEVLGYRIVPDSNNWTVVLVKKRGEDSKSPGEEYTTDMGYFKNVYNATAWILNQYAVNETLAEQKEAQIGTGEIASLQSINKSFEAATKKTLQCVNDLEQRLLAAGYDFTPKNVKNSLAVKP